MRSRFCRGAVLALALVLFLGAAACAQGEDPVLSETLEGSPEAVRDGSTNLTRVLSAALREATGAELSLIHAGAVRGSLSAGRITQEAVQAAVGENLRVQVTQMNGVQLRRLIDAHVETLQAREDFPLVGGLELVLAPTTLEDGSAGAYVLGMGMEGYSIDETLVYSIATLDILSEDGIYDFPQPLEGDYGTLDQVLYDYLRAHTPQEVLHAGEAVELTWQDVESVAPQGTDQFFYVVGIAALAGLAVLVVCVRVRRKRQGLL